MFSDRIVDLVEEFDEEDLIRRFDVDFDAPLWHKYAIGILQMRGAFDPAPDGDYRAAAVRVGAHWCAIVRADVNYDLLEGLRLMNASSGDAERLRSVLGEAGEFTGYAVARWYDGAAKIRYRLGSYSSARISFETAAAIARTHSLDWCLPDLLSNFYRARYEEIRQSAATEHGDKRLQAHVDELAAERDRIAAAVADALAKVRTAGRDDPPVRPRELLRGHSSVLHNLAVALKDQGRIDESLAMSRTSFAVSELLGDEYRIGQSRNHQALLDRSAAPELFRILSTGEWRRGRLIAKQQLAGLVGGEEGVAAIESLLGQLAHDSEATGGTGMDIDLYAFSVRMFASIVDAMKAKDSDATAYEARLSEQRMIMAASVRDAVAMPAYKRAYAKAVRPSYLEAIRSVLDDAKLAPVDRWERAFRFAEESTARELLDMLASAGLPQLQVEAAATPTRLASSASDGRQRSAEPRGARRAGVRGVDTPADDALVGELAQRETEFEERFLRQPLEASPPDPEIAHRMRMYTVNNPGTCVVRFVTYGRTAPARLGAFVFLDHTMTFVEVADYEAVHGLVAELPLETEPSPKQTGAIWELLVAPLWPTISAKGDPRHLVVIPTDELFAMPLHVACPVGTTVPLAARLPLSQSVSATAFVARGRNLLKRQPVAAEDDLAAIVLADGIVTGAEIVETGWDSAHLYVAGNVPDGVGEVWHLPADFSGLAAISAVKPEFFVYAGHGDIHRRFPELGPYLQMEAARLTQYDVALRLRLPRNKLTVLGACLAGQGAQTSGGDVVGFLRSLIAAGAGAVGVPLWSVLDDAMVDTVNDLLVASRRAVLEADSVFDVVDTLHRRYARLTESVRDPSDLPTLLQQMPIGLYL